MGRVALHIWTACRGAVGAVLVLALVLASLSAAGAVTVLPGTTSQNPTHSLEYWPEPTDRSVAMPAILAGDVSPEWSPVEGDVANFGYTAGTHWYRMRLENPLEQPVERLLEIRYPLLDHIEFYRVRDGDILESHLTGDHYPFESRPMRHRTFVLPMELEPESQSRIYLRVRTSGSHQVPMMLWEPETFFEVNETDMVGRSMFYGMLLIIITFNVFLYGALRERSYLYYVLTNATLLVLMASLHGMAFQFLYPAYPEINERVTLVSSAMIALFFSLFARTFLNITPEMRFRRNVFHGLTIVTALNTVAALFISYDLSTRLSVVLAGMVSLIMFLIGLAMMIQGHRAARYFMGAWIMLLVGSMAWILLVTGLVPSNFLTRYGVELGAVSQALVLTFAMGQRFSYEQRARLQAIEERESMEQSLLEQARHHGLTGLPGRNLLEVVLGGCTERVDHRRDCSLALVLIHFRGFDDINKTLGHENADQLLYQLAWRMNEVVLGLPDSVIIEDISGSPCAVAHVEGITFACAFHPRETEAMQGQMEALVEALRQPMEFRGLSLDMRMVGGCSFYPEDSGDITTLLRHAFIAFDQAESGVSHVATYTESMNPYSERRLTLMTELRRAIREDSLALYFQPQVRLSSGEVCGFEVLLRWNHPEHGFIPPDEFIPMAEQTGLIQPLTQWVLDRALLFGAAMDGAGYPVRMAVNISARNLEEPAFAELVQELLERHGLPTGRLILEVTETATMVNPVNALQALRGLYDAGIRLAIDDFGTGYSSLSYIRKLPVHEIKIDRSFVREMDANREDATIVRTTINMCHDLGFEVVAEGVESDDTSQLLRNMQCDIMQGYHLSRPMPEAHVAGWLSTWYYTSGSGG
ncbi:diguanylate cyclase [Halovibrio salipaludis]|uniref:cyclic-guanylate-specific phosphodiesterase n=1 Tax=Halovibrio salipaludis TaxID=2032626 RepID=A0A2A2FB07_9GAMM|nr:EAL domain-containing protein [Halovibrio salipaludis]PAU81867.1 diguanylate cyclase [Halovibrio salipaludis]